MRYNFATVGIGMLQNLKDVTKLLHEWRDGSPDAENELFNVVFPDLRRLAHYLMRGERKDHSMQATELVDQVYFRLVAAKNQDWQNRRHFYAIAARAMRRYLIDHARGRADAEFLPIDEMENFLPGDLGQDKSKLDNAVTIDRLLTEMGKTQPQWCSLVELKYFLGLTDEEAADVLGLKVRTMQRMWRDARFWLHERMEPGTSLDGTSLDVDLTGSGPDGKSNDQPKDLDDHHGRRSATAV